jgi:rhodanese-related sulfurtransferase
MKPAGCGKTAGVDGDACSGTIRSNSGNLAASTHRTRLAAHGVSGMTQNITVHVGDLVAAAEGEIENLPVAEAIKLHGSGDATFVDLRDIRELNRDGRLPGAFHCPRGMLEFWIDPHSKYYKPVFGANRKFVFFCAAGSRSALATQMAQRMGLRPVAHIAGGFGAWKAAGGPVETAESK